MTETERMRAGLIYNALDAEFAGECARSRQICIVYNRTNQNEEDKRAALLTALFQTEPKGYRMIEPPVVIDTGREVRLGANFYANSHFTVIGGCTIEIGDNVFIGPNCTLAAGIHSLVAEERRINPDGNGGWLDYEYGKPIKIGSDVWLASNVVVCGGVTIGDGAVIGAGSVVTKDVPAGTLACGNPCRVLRKITQEDSIYRKARRD